MMKIIFEILSTIRDPDSIGNAKAIVQTIADDILAQEPVRESAADTLDTAIPFHFPLDFIERAGQD